MTLVHVHVCGEGGKRGDQGGPWWDVLSHRHSDRYWRYCLESVQEHADGKACWYTFWYVLYMLVHGMLEAASQTGTWKQCSGVTWVSDTSDTGEAALPQICTNASPSLPPLG